jgi:glycosyltransferase involved in cell wall biosynthesis
MHRAQTTGKSVGLVIFAKNEESSISFVLDDVSKHISCRNIFVIDGHSKDKTPVIVREKNINLFLDPKKGKGSAIRFAIENIDRDILIFMDSDGSHQAKEIPLLLEPILKNDELAMVIGSRFKGGSEEFSDSLGSVFRFIGNLASVSIINLLWKAKLTDVQNGFRAIRRSVIKKMQLTENNFAIEQEMVMKCLKNKKKISEIPSWELKRRYNNSHIKAHQMLPKFIFSFIKNIFYA